MENASKALLMAAAVLFGVMILAVGTFLFFSLGQYGRGIEEDKENVRISAFNSNFTKFEGAKSVTIHEILGLANLAIENNQKYELLKADAGDKSTNYVQVVANVKINGVSRTTSLEQVSPEQFNLILEENSYDKTRPAGQDKQILYKCTKVFISDITKRVYRIEFQKV